MYHFHARVIGRKAKRRSVAVKAAAYRSRSMLYDEVCSKWINYSNKLDLSASFILAPPSSPLWVFDRNRLWNAVEKRENRVDSQVCRELEISLPQVFCLDQSIKVVRDFVTKNCVDLDMIADVSIHGVGSKNPHVHVLLTMRKLDPEGKWGKKSTEWNNRSLVNQWRKSWENALNDEFIGMGMPQISVSCESYKTRGIEKTPQKYCGQRRIRLWREEEIIEPQSAQYVIDQIKKEQEELQREIEFLAMLIRRSKRRAGQMLNDSLIAISNSASHTVVVPTTHSVAPEHDFGNKNPEVGTERMVARLLAIENLVVGLPKPDPGISPGSGFS